MTDLTEIHALREQLGVRLAGSPTRAELRAIYLDLAAVVGLLQGAVAQAARVHGEAVEVSRAQRALDRLQYSLRQVGLDIRLVSDQALLIGLQTVLQGVDETMHALKRLT
ncbi:MAG: hypothetical protein NVSMB22_08680 [Chloroflexota bacterium]